MKAPRQRKTIGIAVCIATVCALCFYLWAALEWRPTAKLRSHVDRVGKDTNGTRSAWCSLDNLGPRGLSVACDYYQIKTPQGWLLCDEYDLGPWYVPPGSSRTVVLPAPSVTNHWRVVWRYTIPATNYSRVERWVDEFCLGKLRRHSPLTPPKVVVTTEIE